MGKKVNSDIFIYESAGVIIPALGDKIRTNSLDSGSPNEYIEIFHDQNSARIKCGSGPIVLDSTYANYYQTAGVSSLIEKGDQANDQYLMGLYASVGKQLVITNNTNIDLDHDHIPQTNPTLFVHSDKSADTDNTEWLSLSHDQTNAFIETGDGDIIFKNETSAGGNGSPGGGTTLPTLTRDGEFALVPWSGTGTGITIALRSGGVNRYVTLASTGSY